VFDTRTDGMTRSGCRRLALAEPDPVRIANFGCCRSAGASEIKKDAWDLLQRRRSADRGGAGEISRRLGLDEVTATSNGACRGASRDMRGGRGRRIHPHFMEQNAATGRPKREAGRYGTSVMRGVSSDGVIGSR